MRRSMAVSILFVAAMVASVVASVPATATPTNVDVSRRHLNESEEAIAVNPTNPENIVVVTNVGRDYSGLSFFGGIANPAWSDNSNSTGTNPDGALHQLDIYTAAVHV
jgi:hypothetical protein